MDDKTCLVVTSISGPNRAMKELARGCIEKGYRFIVIGDKASPENFELEGCDFYSLKRQIEISQFAHNCPIGHYARKNTGYLLAMEGGASVIMETDDDNLPYPGFWSECQMQKQVPLCENTGWMNVYSYFTNSNIWPRGFPLEFLKQKPQEYDSLKPVTIDCPIQQYLADDNPDVDAVYRLLFHLPEKFRKDRQIAAGKGTFCPFNSQNTVWFRPAYKLMYLPGYCSFRMTDIWRSFVAQRIAHENNWPIFFGPPTMYQQRNVHNLLKDFQDEIPGYLNNNRIYEQLKMLDLKSGQENIDDNLRLCYEKLVDMKLVGKQELRLLDEWISECNQR